MEEGHDAPERNTDRRQDSPGQLYLTIVNSISLDVIQAVPAEDGHRTAVWELTGRAFPSVLIFLSIFIIFVKIFSLFLPLCFEEWPI